MATQHGPATGAGESRMILANVRKGRIRRPLRELLYGPEGVGKSTFGADAPEPIFLGMEEGTNQLDVARLPQPEIWQDVLDGIRVLGVDQHAYKTLVVDTLDWIEPLLWADVCRRGTDKGPVENIEEFGYGKGYVVALDGWRVFLSYLERLQQRRQMHVILLAHAQIRPFKNPLGEDFDRYQLKLNEKAGALIKEWSESVLFANFDVSAKKVSKFAKAKGASGKARFIYTQRHAAYDAKTRYSIPERLQLSFEDFYRAVDKGQPADPAELKAKIAEAIVFVADPDTRKRAEDYKVAAGDDATKLTKLLTWISGKVQEQDAGADEERQTGQEG